MKKTFMVTGMHCTSCEVLIREDLEEQPGIGNVEVNHKTGEVKVDFDATEITQKEIIELIEAGGYKVK